MAEMIADHLATNLIQWHNKGVIDFRHFCGRKNELKALVNEIHKGCTVEVWGIGGVGKTTLIQVALLIEILRGKKVITVGKSQAYVSGSGYLYFRKNASHVHHDIIGDTITLDDIGLALGMDYITEIDVKEKKIRQISEMLKTGNLILFIDDFHFAAPDFVHHCNLPQQFSFQSA